jgi:hypothetical protein
MFIIPLFGVITIIYIMVDVALIKKAQQWSDASGADSAMQWRLAAFFGFKLLIDFLRLFRLMLIIFSRVR